MVSSSAKKNYPDLSKFNEARRKSYEAGIAHGLTPKQLEEVIKEDDEFFAKLENMIKNKEKE